MSKYFDDNAREHLESLKQDVADYQKEVESEKIELIKVREGLRDSEVRWAKAVISLY